METEATSRSSEEYRMEVGTAGDLPWCDIFNTESYFRIHECERSFFYRLVSRSSGDVHAVTHFSEVESGVFRSPARGTYGGIDLERPPYEPMVAFLDDVERHLRSRGARRLTLSAAPFAHDPQKATWLFQNLSERGWAVDLSQLNYSVAIDAMDLRNKMKRNNRKRVRKCEREGFVFRPRGFEDARDVYDVIVRNREHRGYVTSMTFEEVRRMAETFPGALSFFSVDRGDEIAAAAVCVRLNERVLYTLYWGDAPGLGQYSPVALLADGIYRVARERGFRLMDTGTVPSLDSGPARGLIRFKEGLGCQASLKLTYTRDL